MRRSARYTGAAVAMAAALLVSGCGSSGDDGDDEGKPSDEQQDEAGNEDEGGEDAADAKPGTVQGVWSTKVDGQDLILTVVGDAATLVQDDTFCTGRLTDAGAPTLTLKCPDGKGEARTNGTVESVEDKSLEVSWNGGDTDTFAKQADAPSDLPTDLGGLEDLIPKS